jgi:hypothetical protein
MGQLEVREYSRSRRCRRREDLPIRNVGHRHTGVGVSRVANLEPGRSLCTTGVWVEITAASSGSYSVGEAPPCDPW